jgi:hypothetical protein
MNGHVECAAEQLIPADRNELVFHPQGLDVWLDSSRRLNSSVRFLLNGLAQRLESTVLPLESNRITCALMLFECSEPTPALRVDASVR